MRIVVRWGNGYFVTECPICGKKLETENLVRLESEIKQHLAKEHNLEI